MKLKRKLIPLLLACLMIISSFAGCGGAQNAVVGTWVNESGSQQISFYEDGKCDVPFLVSGSNYGEESYTIDSNNMLKITNLYGAAITLNYVPLDQVEAYEAQTDTYEQPWWCIDGDKLYINSKDYYFTKQ